MKLGTSIVPLSISVSSAHLLRTLQAFRSTGLDRPIWLVAAGISAGCSRTSSRQAFSRIVSMVTCALEVILWYSLPVIVSSRDGNQAATCPLGGTADKHKPHEYVQSV